MIEERLKNYILTKFESVTQFCNSSGIASSTMFTVFKRGINNTSTSTILRICRALQIDSQALYDGEIKPATLSKIDQEEDNMIDINQIIYEIETSKITCRGKELTDQQKRMIAYATKIAVQMSMKEHDPDNNS